MARIQVKRGDDFEPDDGAPNYALERLIKMDTRFCNAMRRAHPELGPPKEKGKAA